MYRDTSSVDYQPLVDYNIILTADTFPFPSGYDTVSLSESVCTGNRSEHLFTSFAAVAVRLIMLSLYFLIEIYVSGL